MPKVSAKYGHPDATESEFVEHFLNSAVTLDHDADGKKGKLMDEYMKYVAKNLLEVISEKIFHKNNLYIKIL